MKIVNYLLESKDEAKLTELDGFTILLNEDDFSLSWVTTEEIDLFSIWVEIELFCSIAIFLLERTVEWALIKALIWASKLENW